MVSKTPFWKHQLFQSLALGCLTLGLAPFFPEPHIIGKIRWALGGAHGMKLIDWGDLLFHGAPWLGLIGFVIWHKFKNNKVSLKN